MVTRHTNLYDKFVMAVDDIQRRMDRFTGAMDRASIRYALIGGQAVALWVATRDPSAVRVTKDVDVLLERRELDAARAAAADAELDFHETSGIGMFLERHDPSPKQGVHLVWADERVRESDPLAAPGVDQCTVLDDKRVINLECLLEMKLTAHRLHDRVHIIDMINVGLVGPAMADGLPKVLAERLAALFEQAERERR